MAQKVRIIYTNDIHSNINHISGLFEHPRKKENNLIYVDSGDFIEGSAFYNLFKGKPEEYLLKNFYNVINVGNHGFSHYLKLKEHLPIINANIYENSRSVFKKYIKIKYRQMNLLFIGIMSEEAFLSIPVSERQGLEYRDQTNFLIRFMNIAKNKYIIFLLSHAGFECDCLLASYFPHVSAIISGHCHSENVKAAIGKTYVLKALDLGKGYGEIILNKSCIETIHCNKRAHISSSVQYIKKYLEQFHRYKTNVIGKIKPSVIPFFESRTTLLHYLLERLRDKYSADIALLNIPIIRELPQDQSELTYVDLLQLSPFDNTINTFSITVDNFWEQLSIYENQNLLLYSTRKIFNAKLVKIVTSSYLYQNIFANIIKDSKKHQKITNFIKKELIVIGK